MNLTEAQRKFLHRVGNVKNNISPKEKTARTEKSLLRRKLIDFTWWSTYELTSAGRDAITKGG